MAKERAILHCDMNCFYASCEMAYHPELRDKPIAVCGDPERRSGIVLTASYPAKRMGVKTGMPLWEAQQHCRDITFVPAHYDLYTRFSGYTREIFLRYTDQVEPFGLDEAWLDCTASQSLFGTGEEIAKKISDTVKDELGITCSVGVSWNKTMAKLGSDYKKPDAITVINRQNFEKIVFPLPASDLLYVGKKTAAKLDNYAIHTIGDLAKTRPQFLQEKLGKVGLLLWRFANGLDSDPVAKYEQREVLAPIKSIGNSWTTPRDLKTDQDVWIVLYLLAESVAARLRESHFQDKEADIKLESEDGSAADFFACINGDWAKVGSTTDPQGPEHLAGRERYYLTAEQLESVYAPFGFAAETCRRKCRERKSGCTRSLQKRCWNL